MSVHDLVRSGRALAAETRIDVGTIRKAGADPVLNEETGHLDYTDGDVIYVGPCRVRQPSLVELTQVFGDANVTTSRFVISFDVDIPPLTVGDTITVESRYDKHAHLRKFRVSAIPTSTMLMSRRFGVEVDE